MKKCFFALSPRLPVTLSLIAVFLSFLFTPVAQSQDGGQPGSVFRALRSSRDAGRGGVGAMWDGSVYSMNSNPAGLGLVQNFEAVVDFGFRGLGRRVHYLGTGWPASKNFVLGLGWMSATSGKSLEGRTGPSVEPDFLFSAGQNLFQAGSAYRIHEKWVLGLGGKLYHQRVYLTSQVGFGLDAGIVWLPLPGYGAGLSVRDLGGSLRTAEIPAEKLPLRLLLGLSGKIPISIVPLAGYIDLGYTQRQSLDVGIGLDVVVRPEIMFRAGWKPSGMALGLALGAHRGRWDVQLDYALSTSPIQFFRLEHRVGLGFSLRVPGTSKETPVPGTG